jgi:hypothetical protein
VCFSNLQYHFFSVIHFLHFIHFFLFVSFPLAGGGGGRAARGVYITLQQNSLEPIRIQSEPIRKLQRGIIIIHF